MNKTFSGVCPVQNKEYNISVEYIDNTSLSNTQRTYLKGLATCKYNQYGDKCNAEDCPIIKLAPETL